MGFVKQLLGELLYVGVKLYVIPNTYRYQPQIAENKLDVGTNCRKHHYM